MGSIPGQRAKIPHASQPENQDIKQKQYCNKFNKDFKNGPHQKNKNKRKSDGLCTSGSMELGFRLKVGTDPH